MESLTAKRRKFFKIIVTNVREVAQMTESASKSPKN